MLKLFDTYQISLSFHFRLKKTDKELSNHLSNLRPKMVCNPKQPKVYPLKLSCLQKNVYQFNNLIYIYQVLNWNTKYHIYCIGDSGDSKIAY